MKIRLVLTATLVVAYALFNMAYGPFRTNVQARMATGQVSNDPATAALARAAAQNDLLITWVSGILVALLVLIWITVLPTLLRLLRDNGNGKIHIIALVVMLFVLPSLACAPYKKDLLEEIAPNETAFLVPLEDTKDSQAQFQSVQYLNEKKVAGKRVTIPQRDLHKGYMPWELEYIPTMKVIKVDRTPAVREWTKATDSGTSANNQAFRVESNESIDFWIGGVASASIKEEDAATFLYNFPNKPLAQVMDSNVRNMVQKILFNEFGIRSLDQGRQDKKVIFSYTEEQVRAAFKPLGLTIDYVGGSEGMTYADPKIQEGINTVFAAQLEKSRQEALKRAQEETNLKDISVAETAKRKVELDADANAYRTRTEAIASADALRLRGEQLDKHPSLVDFEVAQRYKGDVPETVVDGGGGNLPGFFLNPGRRTTPVQR